MNAIQLLACPSCGKPLRSDNGSGVCYLCQQKNRGTKTCTNCGRIVSRRNQSGLCATCFVQRIVVLVVGKP